MLFASLAGASERAGSSATGFVLSSAAFSGFGSSADKEGGSVLAVRCHAGIVGFGMVVCNASVV